MTIKRRLEKLESIDPPREVRVVRLIGNETVEEACARLGIEDDENTVYTNAWMDLEASRREVEALRLEGLKDAQKEG